MQVNKQQLEPGMEQLTGSKLWKHYDKSVYCHPAHVTYMQSTSWEMMDLMNLQARIKIARRNINSLRYADVYHSKGKEKLNSLLMKV